MLPLTETLVLKMLHCVDCHIEIQSKTVRKAWREGGLGWGSGVEWGGGCERDALQGSTSWTPVQKSNGGIWLVREIQISNLIPSVVCTWLVVTDVSMRHQTYRWIHRWRVSRAIFLWLLKLVGNWCNSSQIFYKTPTYEWQFCIVHLQFVYVCIFT